MPELPEVETIRRRLETVLLDKLIVTVTVSHPKTFQGNLADIEGTRIIAVKRRAKILQFDLDNDLYLISHLKMTGQWIYVDSKLRLGGGHPTADWVQALPSKHTRVQFELAPDARLYFNDQRLFGWIKVVTKTELDAEYHKLGPDITDSSFTVEYFSEKLARTSISIKQAIMDNTIVCGVGNIYACDALNLARLSPFKSAKTLDQEEVLRLYQATLQVINTGIQLGGATIEHFMHIDGFGGNYQHVVLVYNRENKPCKNCGNIIVKAKHAGRGTYYCPQCQL